MPQTIGGYSTQPQIQSGQAFWSQSIGLYNGYIYDKRQEQVNTQIIILSGIWHQGALCQGISDFKKSDYYEALDWFIKDYGVPETLIYDSAK